MLLIDKGNKWFCFAAVRELTFTTSTRNETVRPEIGFKSCDFEEKSFIAASYGSRFVALEYINEHGLVDRVKSISTETVNIKGDIWSSITSVWYKK